MYFDEEFQLSFSEINTKKSLLRTSVRAYVCDVTLRAATQRSHKHVQIHLYHVRGVGLRCWVLGLLGCGVVGPA